MKHEIGICPKCGSDEIVYGGMNQDGQSIGYEWKCPDCDAEGIEWYNLEFVEHEITAEGEMK